MCARAGWKDRAIPFSFSTIGQLAAIGRRTGVANIFGINFSGFITWWMWRSKLPDSRRSFVLRWIGLWIFCSRRISCNSRLSALQLSRTWMRRIARPCCALRTSQPWNRYARATKAYVLKCDRKRAVSVYTLNRKRSRTNRSGRSHQVRRSAG